MIKNDGTGLIGPSRTKIYLVFGPLVGVFCLLLHYEDFNVIELTKSMLDSNPFPLMLLAYVYGGIPATATGLISDIIFKALSGRATTLLLNLSIAALIGILVTLVFFSTISFFTGEKIIISDIRSGSGIAPVIYGAIAAIICEATYLKLNN